MALRIAKPALPDDCLIDNRVYTDERLYREEFDKLFDWSDAIIDVPFGSDTIGMTIDELESQPARVEQIRRRNVCQALNRHDWAYRWETVLARVGLEPMPQLLERKERLRRIASTEAL